MSWQKSKTSQELRNCPNKGKERLVLVGHCAQHCTRHCAAAICYGLSVDVWSITPDSKNSSSQLVSQFVRVTSDSIHSSSHSVTGPGNAGIELLGSAKKEYFSK